MLEKRWGRVEPPSPFTLSEGVNALSVKGGATIHLEVHEGVKLSF